MPGFGESPPPADPDHSSMDRWADLVAGGLDQLGVDTATVVGCSMGGYLAMALLRRHPGRVSRVVLADTKARSDEPSAAARRTETQNQVRAGSEIRSLAKGTVEGLLSGGSMARPELVSYVHALAEGATPEGWIGALEAMKGRSDSMLVLRQAKLPALVVVGELDRVTPIAEARSVRLLLKGELVVIPNVGHLPNIEDPLAFNEVLARFLGVATEAEEGSEVEVGAAETDPDAEGALEEDVAP